MRRFGIVILLSLCAFFSSAQSDPFFSHYMFNPLAYNPGWMGDATTASATFQHRSQWAGYSTTFDGDGGAPNSQLLSVIIPVQGVISSAGALISLDQQGPERTIRVQAGAAYNMNLQKGILSFGLMPSLISRTLDFSQFRFETPGDPLDIGTVETQTKLDLSAGAFFRSYSGYFGGVAVDHILSPSLIQVEGATQLSGQLNPTYYVHGGKVMSVNRDLDITPSLLVKYNISGVTADVSGIATYRDLMWGGLSYRRSEAIILLIGYNFLEDKTLKIGYSFDYVIQDQEAKRPTSHEIFLQYQLPSLILGGRKAVKTPRFSF